MRKSTPPRTAALASLLAVWVLFATPSAAQTVWTDWTSFTAGPRGNGSAQGSLGVVAVTYSGQLIGAIVNGSSPLWAPDSSFIGGTVTASPSTVKDDLRLNGRFQGKNTINFDTPVLNPVIAIWSLGAPRNPATFTFDAAPTVEAGGPSRAYRGSSITVSDNVVSGNESNGVVQFSGAFTAISWTNTYEHYYAITVGINGPLQPATKRPLDRQ
jgi:hypothetical protein